MNFEDRENSSNLVVTQLRNAAMLLQCARACGPVTRKLPEMPGTACWKMIYDSFMIIYDSFMIWFVMISPRAVWCTMCLTGDGSFEKAKVVVISRYQPLSSSSWSSSPPSITFIVMSWLRYVRLCFYGHCCLVWTLLKCPPSYCSFRPLPMASSLVHRIHLH